MTGSRVIVALDAPDSIDALEIASRLDPKLCRVKVGKELFVAAGPAVVESLRERGFQVFLDLKFHDIPNTVAGACRSAARLGVWMMNVHASGGEAMLRAAREAVEAVAPRPLVIGVTVLTSLADADLAAIGFSGSAEANVERLAALSKRCGLDGVVCSPREATLVTRTCGRGFLRVTPGIRLPDAAADDQSRTLTPREAVAAGADYLVIGRPITRASDPVAVLARINESLSSATFVGTPR
jgi:orotidine-5'-phosphate decarboxylase